MNEWNDPNDTKAGIAMRRGPVYSLTVYKKIILVQMHMSYLMADRNHYSSKGFICCPTLDDIIPEKVEVTPCYGCILTLTTHGRKAIVANNNCLQVYHSFQ